jgi:hypothetical protein
VGADGVFSMLLTKCASCAAELGLTSGKKCGRCSTRYCGAECQKQHWEDGGHDKLCKKIKRGGGAEQFHADNKCAEAVAVAVAKCADDTAGQTCYICTEAVHRRTGEGLVRGCACGDRDGVASGTTGVVHVSCLAEQAKLLSDEAEENNLDWDAKGERWARWYTCSLCEQKYHGVVRCALGWACWKTYVGRPEADWARRAATTELGCGLHSAKHYEDALTVREADMALARRLGETRNMLVMLSNLASTYEELGRRPEALPMRQEVYSVTLQLYGEEHIESVIEGSNLAVNLIELRPPRFKEAKSLLRKTIPAARRLLGESHIQTLRIRASYAWMLSNDVSPSLDDLREAVTTLEEIQPIARRVVGGAHPFTAEVEPNLQYARAALRARETPPPSSIA